MLAMTKPTLVHALTNFTSQTQVMEEFVFQLDTEQNARVAFEKLCESLRPWNAKAKFADPDAKLSFYNEIDVEFDTPEDEVKFILTWS